MKQFNLEEYLKNPLRKVVTREGKNVKILCTNFTKAQHIIAQIEGNDYSTAFHKDGIFVNGFESNCDLFFAPEKHEGWVNLYRDIRDITYVGGIYISEKEAKENIYFPSRYITTFKIEWEE